jgi:hypothetical protein
MAIAASVVALARCGAPPSSTSLTSPTPVAAVLTVGGNLVFTAIGQTSQLTAIAGDGSTVSAGVTWTSLVPGIVSVSPNGLATALAFGSASIRATAPGASGTSIAVVAATPSATAKTISTCQTISAAGSYVLTADVSSTGTAACLQIATTALVQLDCQGHTISGLSISSAHGIAVSNCVVSGVVSMTNADNTTAANVTFNGGLSITKSSSVTIGQSTLHPRSGVNTTALVSLGTNVQFVQDTVTGTGVPAASAALYFMNGTHNQVRQCTLDGSYDGGPAERGVDDGVLLINEVGDIVQDNTIANFFDTAVEGVDLVANATITGNHVTNVGATAIGSYWCTSWTGNVISNNDASQAPTLLYVFYEQGLGQCGPTSLPPAFTGNQIVGNRFRTPALGIQPFLPSAGGRSVPTLGSAPRIVVAISLAPVSGNLIQGNDLGTTDGPFLLPLSGFANGGGNTCAPLNAAVSNFPCGGT